jgi:hypothetical protein
MMLLSRPPVAGIRDRGTGNADDLTRKVALGEARPDAEQGDIDADASRGVSPGRAGPSAAASAKARSYGSEPPGVGARARAWS